MNTVPAVEISGIWFDGWSSYNPQQFSLNQSCQNLSNSSYSSMRQTPFSEQCQNQKYMEQSHRFIEHFQYSYSTKIRNSSCSREAMSKKPGHSPGRIAVVGTQDSMNQISMQRRGESRTNSEWVSCGQKRLHHTGINFQKTVSWKMRYAQFTLATQKMNLW